MSRNLRILALVAVLGVAAVLIFLGLSSGSGNQEDDAPGGTTTTTTAPAVSY